MVGETVSHYRILEELGGGAMGVVYKAQDARLKRLVALKFLPAELTRDEDARRRFVQEAETASALDHANVCTIHDIDQTSDGRVFIAMAFYDGETLRRRIQRGPMPIEEVVSIAQQVALALQAAQGAGIVHRDVKPTNIMLTSSGVVKLLDFGIAKLTGQADLTQTGSSVGTVAYMAPEQFEGHVDGRTDLWALGVVLYEMLTGQRPFDAADSLGMMHAVFHQQPAAVRTLRPESPAGLVKVIDRALQKKPAQRYATAAQMAADIDACRSPAAVVPGSVLRTLLRPAVVLPVLTVAMAVSYVMVTTLLSQSRMRWARETAIPEISRLLQTDAYGPAHALALEAGRYIPNDPVLQSQLKEMTGAVPIVVANPTARVFARPYDDRSAAWQLLGSGAPADAALPRGAYVFRIEAEGFDTTELARNVTDGLFEKPEPIELVPSGQTSDDMVIVPGSLAPVELTGFASEDPVAIDSFAIDRYEVTNQQFKAFVDAGGYARQEYWKHPVVHDGRELSWPEAMALFLDSSGRPGPATWELGRFREGQANHPVTGVSWYEAAAYAEYRKASLPTIYHWARAALAFTRSAPIRGLIVKASHYQGTDVVPVGSTGAIGPFGTYDMAGNVREWCSNASGTHRWSLGGGVGMDQHMYVVPYSMPPSDRSPISGFRLVRYLKPDGVEALLKPREVFRRDFRTAKPVDDDVFAIFKRQLAPVAAPTNPVVASTEAMPEWTREVVSIDTGLGDRMRVFLFIPKDGRARHQVVIAFPGLTPFTNTSVAGVRSPSDIIRNPDFLVKSGRILVYPIWKGSYERFDGFVTLTGNRYFTTFRQRMREWTQEQSQVIDYLTSRDDVDPHGFSYWGGSFGASTTLPVLAMEPRYKAAMLDLAGFTYREMLPEVDAVNFVSRITIPTLMLEARYDHLFPVELSQQPLFNLLGTPANRKRMVLFDAGHGMLPRGQMIKETLDWLDTHVGPAR